MILASVLAVAAVCGGVNFILNDRYSDDAINRDRAAKWGVWGATASMIAVLAFAGVVNA